MFVAFFFLPLLLLLLLLGFDDPEAFPLSFSLVVVSASPSSLVAPDMYESVAWPLYVLDLPSLSRKVPNQLSKGIQQIQVKSLQATKRLQINKMIMIMKHNGTGER